MRRTGTVAQLIANRVCKFIQVNYLLVYKQEIIESVGPRIWSVIIRGARARSVIEAHELKPGIEIAAGLLGGDLGQARIKQVVPDEVSLELECLRPPPDREKVSLVVAVPRPQTVKKILQLAGCLGLEEVCFVGSDNSVKSYLQSKSLKAACVEEEVLKGLEQGGDTIMPIVKVFLNVTEYFEELDKSHEENTFRLIADTRDASRLVDIARERRDLANKWKIIAIGPESGWAEHERQRFNKRGFCSVSLGKRMLRVDTAACFLLGQMSAISNISR